MSKDKVDGGYVYPGAKVKLYEVKDGTHESVSGHQMGITRRDWLAGLAMQGLISVPFETVTIVIDGEKIEPESMTKSAYRIADAMILEGKKGGE
jgi:hypothetical protein